MNVNPERVSIHPKVTQQIRGSGLMEANNLFCFWTFSEKLVSRKNYQA